MIKEEADEFKRPILEKYENEGNPCHSTARPKSMKYLEMESLDFPPDWLTLPQLERLKLLKCPKSALLQLPQSLKSLELAGIFDCAFDRPDEFVPLLPKNLTKFKLPNYPFRPMTPSSELQKLSVSLTNFEVGISTDRPDAISLFHPQTRHYTVGVWILLSIIELPSLSNQTTIFVYLAHQ